MAEGSNENDTANCELNDRSLDSTEGNDKVTDSTKGVEDTDNFYEELNKQTDSDFIKLKEMEEHSSKMRKEIALLKLDVASSFSAQCKRAESMFEENIMKASETVQEIERLLPSELEEISKLFSEC